MNPRILTCLLLFLGACTQRPVRPFPSYDLIVAIRQSDVLDLGTSVPIPWDHVFIFGPYSAEEKIRKVAGTIILSQVTTSDSHCLLLFISDTHVTGYVELERKLGDFSEFSGRSFSRDNARFRKTIDEIGFIRLKNEK